jgi:hypothetical protein
MTTAGRVAGHPPRPHSGTVKTPSARVNLIFDLALPYFHILSLSSLFPTARSIRFTFVPSFFPAARLSPARGKPARVPKNGTSITDEAMKGPRRDENDFRRQMGRDRSLQLGRKQK